MTDDGIAGTDNISVLFPEKPSAAPIPPQPEVLQVLDEFGLEVAGGAITGVIIIGFRDTGMTKVSISGKVPFKDAVTSLEQMRFGIMARDYAQTIVAAQTRD